MVGARDGTASHTALPAQATAAIPLVSSSAASSAATTMTAVTGTVTAPTGTTTALTAAAAAGTATPAVVPPAAPLQTSLFGSRSAMRDAWWQLAVHSATLPTAETQTVSSSAEPAVAAPSTTMSDAAPTPHRAMLPNIASAVTRLSDAASQVVPTVPVSQGAAVLGAVVHALFCRQGLVTLAHPRPLEWLYGFRFGSREGVCGLVCV